MKRHRQYVLVAALSAILASTAPVLADTVPTGPAGDAFYTAPTPLPAGEAGSLVWSRPLDGTMAMPSAARNILLMYRSVDPAGKSVPVSGTVSIPQGTAPAGGWPVITWTHGTTGLNAVCGPSRDTRDGPEHEYIATIQTLLDGFVRDGYAVVATDYQGLGMEGFHPFLQGVPNGRNALDMIRAARQLEPELGTRYAVMGHSQGGQADLFTASQGPAYLPGYELVGNVAMAPGSHIAARLDAVMKSDKVELALPYVLYVLNSYSTTYPEIDLTRILTAEAISHLPDLMVECMTHALSTGYWSTAIAKDQFLPNPDLAALLKVAAQNEPGSLDIKAPTMILQGAADKTVRPPDTDLVAKELCAGGNDVDYRIYPGADHDGAMTSGAGDAHEWLKARFAKLPATSNCGSLPTSPSP